MKDNKKILTLWVAFLAILVAIAVGASVLLAAWAGTDGAPAEKAVILFDVTADENWNDKSTSVLVEIKGTGEENGDVEFYHSIAPSQTGGAGTSRVEVVKGNYVIKAISPVNDDGSIYEIIDVTNSGAVQIADDENKITVEIKMARIPADEVNDTTLEELAGKIKVAVAKGDETLSGEKGKDELRKAEENISKNPNVQPEQLEETFASQEASSTDPDSAPADTEPELTQGQDQPSAGSSAASSQATTGTAHQHVWKEHTAQRWVSKIVEVPDYETQQVAVGTKFVFSEDGYVAKDVNEARQHAKELVLAGKIGNYHTETIYETQTVQVGSHQEDQGHYETYVDYYYCDCGARK